MQPSLRALVAVAFLPIAHASPFEARSALSAVPVPVTDGSKALAQAQPAGLATSKAAMGGVPGAAIPAGLEPHDLTSNAAQSDPLLYICSKQKCGGTCMYFDLTTLTPNTCYSPTTPFPFLSTFINDGNAPLAYEVFVSPFANCTGAAQITAVQTCYNVEENNVVTDFYYFYFT